MDGRRFRWLVGVGVGVGVLAAAGVEAAPPPRRAAPAAGTLAGAGRPRPAEAAPARDWWAYRPVTRPEVPTVRDAAWVRTPIDAFILARLEREGLSPAAPAEPGLLYRRLSFGVTGLPPDPEDVERFRKTPSDAAYEQAVTDLLSQPEYGERMARRWLDLARYADTAGFERDRERPNAWRYRDYVVRAFNQDLPYDRFVREQLAADEVAPEDREARAALGFLAAGPSVDDRPELRPAELDDLVSTVSSVFMAQTVGCARCHHHRYDPIQMQDYYRVASVFAGVKRQQLVVAPEAEVERVRAENAVLEAELAPVREELARLEAPYRARVAAENGGKVPARKLDEAVTGADRAAREALQARIREGEGRRKTPASVHAVAESGPNPPRTYLLLRGDPGSRGEEIAPALPAFLTGAADPLPAAPRGGSSGRRRAFAEWLTLPDHPLTARVLVNRLWQWHFGKGLAPSASDLGRHGGEPSHPELLDWLAGELVRSGWSLKHVQRLILTSSTYRQASVPAAGAREKDPEGRLLAWFPLRRLEGEELRDALLAVSDSLNPRMGGPGVFPPIGRELVGPARWPETKEGPDVWRRSLYIHQQRSLRVPLLGQFDCPDGAASQAERSRTTIATQALALQNDPFVRLMAERFAARVRREAGTDPEKQVRRAALLALGREPDAAELPAALAFLKEQPARLAAWNAPRRAPGRRPAPAPRVDYSFAALADYCLALFNSSGFLYVE